MKKLTALVTLIALVNLLTGCAPTGGTGRPAFPPGGPGDAIQAIVYPELRLVTTDGTSHKGKLTRCQGKVLTLRPSPYWNVQDIQIPLDTVHQINLTEPREDVAGKSFMMGFSILFIPIGAIGAANSKYNSNFSMALAGSVATGVVAGLLGLAIGAVGNTSTPSIYKFYAMSEPEKWRAVLEIMGRAGSRP